MMLRSSLWLGSASLFMFAATAVAGQIADRERVREALGVVETWLDAQQAYQQIPGLSAAVVHDQELVWSTAMGVAHRESGEPATPQTLYSICSISKLFTSVAVMQLRDRGLLRLADPVSEHLPWFSVEQSHEGSPPVTVEGVLTHSAGLPRESNHPYWTAPDFPFPTRGEIIEGLSDQEMLYASRAYYQYSNLGLTLAGELVTALAGEPYDQYVRKNVLEPLGLHGTYPEIPAEHRGRRLATGYGSMTRDGLREPVAFFQTRGIAPAAGFASTAEDLARFAMWQFRLRGEEDEVLHAHTLDEMQRVHYVDPDFDTFRGLGFGITRRAGKTFVGHGGSCPGFRSQLILEREDKVAVVFMANAMVGAGTFAHGIYDLVAEAIADAAPEDPSVVIEEAEEPLWEKDGPDLTPFLGTYSRQPWGSETAVVRWKGSLALMSVPTDDPADALTRLKHDEGDVFFRVRSDGTRGEDVIFHRDPSGTIRSFSVHGNHSRRLEPGESP